jgi:AcrB/AcrD/AcrF family
MHAAGDKAQLTEIEVGLRTPGEVEMKAGLSKMDVVVIEGHEAPRRRGHRRRRTGERLALMGLSDLSIQRPVLATVRSLMVVLLGIMAYERLPVREYPNIDTPVVSVRTACRGASSKVIAPEPAAVAERFRSPQSRREWAQRR